MKYQKQKIPDHAQCVYSGILHDVYHWDQELFDGSTNVFECVRIRPGACVLTLTNQNTFLFNSEEQPHRVPYVGLVGGFMNIGENDPLKTIRRELLEETGYEAQVWEHHETADYCEWAGYETCVHIFFAKHAQKVTEQKLDAGEKIEVLEIPVKKFHEILGHPKLQATTKFILQDILHSSQKYARFQNFFGITDEFPKNNF